MNEAAKRYRQSEKGRAAINARKRRYRQTAEGKAAHSAEQKQYNLAHPERIAKRNKLFRETNKEEVKAKKKQYHEANRDQCLLRTKKWFLANPEARFRHWLTTKATYSTIVGLSRCLCYRIKERVSSENITIRPEHLHLLWELQKGICSITGQPMELGAELSQMRCTVDRINPAGWYHPGNVRLVTMWGNTAKGGLTDQQLVALCKCALGQQAEPELPEPSAAPVNPKWAKKMNSLTGICRRAVTRIRDRIRVGRIKGPDAVCAIDYKYVLNQWHKQNGKCVLTGLSLRIGNWNHPLKISVDRIDHNLGYLEGNIRLVGFWANMARNSLNDEEFKRMCGLVVKHLGRTGVSQS